MNDYSDALKPNLERALEEAPAYYQAAFLMATFLANRIDEPERVRASFEAALSRYPHNGRLHLTYAEWLLTPRAPAPYRRFREAPSEDLREKALSHVEEATRLEPDLTRTALRILLRFRVPSEEWAARLPRTERTELLILEAVDRSPSSRRLRETLLRQFLTGAETMELQQRITVYARRWDLPEIATEGAEKWRGSALALGAGNEIVGATASLASLLLDGGENDRAFSLIRETLDALEEQSIPAETAVDLLANVGTTYLNRGRRAMAQALLTEAVTLSPYHVPSHLGLARIFRDSGDLEEARRELESVLRIEPANAQALGMLGEVQGKTEP